MTPWRRLVASSTELGYRFEVLMAQTESLDEFLDSQPLRIHRSDRKLAKMVREAYPIGVPALIMKSSTDRLGESAGYEFHLGTPDELLRRLASWLLTGASDNQRILLRLVGRLWARHGREDVALAALLLANLDHASLGTDPWQVLSSSIRETEPAEALLLSIEELVRAGREIPSDEVVIGWCQTRRVDGHLAILVAHAGSLNAQRPSEGVLEALGTVEIPTGDSLLGRIMDRMVSSQA